MENNKKKAYAKLLEYVKEIYPDENNEWLTDEETEDNYSMRVILPNKKRIIISIDYETLSIIDNQ